MNMITKCGLVRDAIGSMHHVIHFSALITQYMDVARPPGARPWRDKKKKKFTDMTCVLNIFNLQLEKIESI